VGAAVFIGLIGVGVYSGFSIRKHTDERNGNLGLAAAAGVAGIAVSFVTFDTLAFRQATGITFLLLGIAGSAWMLTRRERAARAGIEPPEDTETADTTASDPPATNGSTPPVAVQH
jgi:hypothetical protein